MGREDGGDFNKREDGGSLNGKRENLDGEIREMSDSEHMEEDELCVGDLVSGILVPEGGITKLWKCLFGPSECLTELKHVARVTSIDNMLELTELKCWLSTFYRVTGGYQLPLYHEPQPIPGLEDKYHNRVLDLSNDAEGQIKGPVEKETNQPLLQKCLVDSGLFILYAKNGEEDVTKEGTGLGNPVSSSLRKKRKDNDEANGETNLSSTPERRKVTKLLVSNPATRTPGFFCQGRRRTTATKLHTLKIIMGAKKLMQASRCRKEDSSKR